MITQKPEFDLNQSQSITALKKKNKICMKILTSTAKRL